MEWPAALIWAIGLNIAVGSICETYMLSQGIKPGLRAGHFVNLADTPAPAPTPQQVVAP